MNKTQVQNGPLRGASETAVPRQAPTDPLLLEQLRREIRVRHYSIRTEHAYTEWTERFLRHYEGRRPQDMGAVEINRYLSFLATDCNVAASTQNQALSALLFLYTHVLQRNVGSLGEVVRAKRPVRVPVVLSAAEVERLLVHLHGTHKLMVLLMYGSGMRIIEVIRLRVKDVDFELRSITVRDGKGQKDRQVPLPLNTIESCNTFARSGVSFTVLKRKSQRGHKPCRRPSTAEEAGHAARPGAVCTARSDPG